MKKPYAKFKRFLFLKVKVLIKGCLCMSCYNQRKIHEFCVVSICLKIVFDDVGMLLDNLTKLINDGKNVFFFIKSLNHSV